MSPSYLSPLYFLPSASASGASVLGGEPRAKRPRYDQSEDVLSEEEFDLDNYYTSDPGIEVPEEVQSFLESTFRRCIPRKRRLEIGREYPEPNLDVIAVPQADKDIISILDKDFPSKEDKLLSRVQAAVLASSAPLTNLWTQLAASGFSGKEDEVIPTKEVMNMIKQSLALIGNASHYITTTRRGKIIEKIKPTRPQLASFLTEVCTDPATDNPGKELFGPPIKKKISERAETIESFNKALSRIDPPKQARSSTDRSCRFLGKSSGGLYSSNPSSQRPQLYGKRVFKPFHFRKRHNPTNQTKQPFRPKGKPSQ